MHKMLAGAVAAAAAIARIVGDAMGRQLGVGIGGSPHLAALTFEKAIGTGMTRIPYKSGAPALQAVAHTWATEDGRRVRERAEQAKVKLD